MKDFPTSPRLKQVVEVLRQEGAKEEQIALMLQELTKTAFARMYAEAVTAFDEEDLAAIDQAISPQQANLEIRRRFREKTGQDPDEVLRKFLDTFADKFLEEHQKNQRPPG